MSPKKKTEAPKPAAPTKRAESAKAFAKFLRVGPRKMRLVIDVIRHKPTSVAFSKLYVMKQKSARMVEKLLSSAVANAKVLGLDESKLVVAEVRADGGPMMKRFMARSMGRADRILKRTTHLSLIVKEGNKSVNDVTPAGNEAAAESAEGKKQAKQKEKPAKKKAGAASQA